MVFNDERSMDYEVECDAAKFMSEESAVQLFTIGTGLQPVYYSINERPCQDGIVHLGFTTRAEGSYMIAAPRMDQAMALKDNETGTVHSFSEGPYEFFAPVGRHLDRFVLIPDQQTTGLSTLLAEGIKVEALDGGINIVGLGDKMACIYNAAGQKIAIFAESGRMEVSPGAYVVQVGDVTTKIVVR